MTDFILWGVTASPYQIKMQALLNAAGYSWRRYPEQAGRLRAVTTALRLGRARRRGEVEKFPGRPTELEEYPAVPYYSMDGRTFHYDSSALAAHIDQLRGTSAPPLVPTEPLLAFVCRLIDEAFDEFGLYMVHHMRWVGSARSVCMGDFTAREMAPLLPPGMPRLLARRLYRRQVRRCPYLFSVAPQGFDARVGAARTPPARSGFPATHELLESNWRAYLAALEEVLCMQPWLLGERFTLADASACGQFGMNLADPEAADLMRQLAPRTFDWLCRLRDGKPAPGGAALALAPALRPLLASIGETFVPLMRDNERAYEAAVGAGETLFNEAAFDSGQALYDGELQGHPYRTVVKTFQVEVWRELRLHWQALPAANRDVLERDWLPGFGETIAGPAHLS